MESQNRNGLNNIGVKELLTIIDALVEKKLTKRITKLENEMKIILTEREKKLNLKFAKLLNEYKNNKQPIPSTSTPVTPKKNVITDSGTSKPVVKKAFAQEQLSPLKFSDNPTLNQILSETASQMTTKDMAHLDENVDESLLPNDEGTVGVPLSAIPGLENSVLYMEKIDDIANRKKKEGLALDN